MKQLRVTCILLGLVALILGFTELSEAVAPAFYCTPEYCGVHWCSGEKWGSCLCPATGQPSNCDRKDCDPC